VRRFLWLCLASVLPLCAACEAAPAVEPTTLTAEVSTSQKLDWWHPTTGLTWQWQLTGRFDFDIQADVYDIDLHVDKSAVDYFHAQGARVICYISVGSWENWRPDADQFPPEVIGRDYKGWAGEKWLDIRQIDQIAPIMRARLDMCTAKGFDAVEPDNMEIYTDDTGFPLTYDDQLRYALWLAEEAHQRGLAIGQKNAPDQTHDLVDVYDFAITEDAFYYGWAADMLPYIQAGKPVFAAEYTDTDVDFEAACEFGRRHGPSFILKNRNLGAFRETCP